MMRHFAVLSFLVVAACGPTNRSGNNNGSGSSDAPAPQCVDGQTQACYDGSPGTQGTGPCHGGMQTCSGGTWGACNGEVVPVAEVCGDGIDQNCNGVADEADDNDHDGYFTCPTDGSKPDCCDSTECADPAHVNPGAFEDPTDGIDNNCNGQVDEQPVACDSGLHSDTPMDYAKAIDICQTATADASDHNWGVISAKWTLADGNGTPSTNAYSIRPHFGGTMPKFGSSVMEISTGHAAAKNDPAAAPPTYIDFEAGDPINEDNGNNTDSPFPQPFYLKNGNKLPRAPGCNPPSNPIADLSKTHDPAMLTLKIRVPSNANSFTMNVNFFTSEFPEYVCSAYNDFFVVLLDSMYQPASSADPANPDDGNLAFYKDAGGAKYPVGVNLAGTGLFTQCVNGHTGCASGLATPGTITTCASTADLTNTGLDKLEKNNCDMDSLEGGGTGWLQTSGNVVPGEVMTLRIAIWDMGDHALDSIAVIDSFKWGAVPVDAGTVISKTRPTH